MGDNCYRIIYASLVGKLCSNGGCSYRKEFASSESGALVAQWVKHWPTDLADLVYICSSVRSFCPSVRPLFGENFSSKISQQPCKLECSYLVCRLMTTCYIVGLRTSLLLLFVPLFVQFSFLLTLMKFFVKDFSTTMQGRMLIFGMHVDDDLLYREIENQSSPSSLYLSNFFSVHTLKNDIFHQRFLYNYAH